jgi:hypothetical protein
MTHGFEWEVVKEPPPHGRRGRPSLYATTLSEFLKTGVDCVCVDVGIRTPGRVVNGFAYAIKTAKAGHLILVCQRQGKVYLQRKDGR